MMMHQLTCNDTLRSCTDRLDQAHLSGAAVLPAIYPMVQLGHALKTPPRSGDPGMTFMTSRLWAAALLTTLIISGCHGYGGPYQRPGVVVGTVHGGWPGNVVRRGPGRTPAIIVGTLVGIQIAGSIGRTMDDLDRLRVAHSLEIVRTGVPTTWVNPDTHYQYSVVPTRTYERSDTVCREYTIDATIGGKTEQVYGTACRQADGSWKVQG